MSAATPPAVPTLAPGLSGAAGNKLHNDCSQGTTVCLRYVRELGGLCLHYTKLADRQ